MCCDIAELPHDLVKPHGMKAEVLAARANRLWNVLGLRSGHHENNVARRLFESLQQRIEGSIGDLVSFVENVDLVAIASGTITRGVA